MTKKISSVKKPAPTVKSMLHELLLKGVAGSQEEICGLLAKQGYVINQSKVSRLLRKVGAVKITNEQGEVVYCLPKEPAPPATKSPLTHLVISILSNEYSIVIRTSPGAASLIARLLDYHRDELFILGTIAGDDTILVIPASMKKIVKTLSSLKALLHIM